MKKRIAAIMLLMLMLLAGCGENTPAETPAPSTAILSHGDCFVVAEDNSSGITKYLSLIHI